MADKTGIQYCDSTGNVQMGCEGCELVKGKDIPTCYAKGLTDRYQGLKGWPVNFETPKLFLERVPKIVGMRDLRGTKRPDKPWLDDMPRVIFLNDMGDTMSQGMPEDWFAEILPALAGSPHFYLVLTKWPKRFAEFSKRYPLPANVWPGTSVTSDKTAFRVGQLAEIESNHLWVSAEPLWSDVNWRTVKGIERIKWLVLGGESGSDPQPFELDWLMSSIHDCRALGIAPFVKQLGARPVDGGVPVELKHGHGGDMTEWPPWCRIREMPENGRFPTTIQSF